MRARYLILTLAFTCPVPAEDPRPLEVTDLQLLVNEVAVSLKTPGSTNGVAALKDKTCGKRLILTDASITEINETDALPLSEARNFAGLYTIDGSSHPDRSTLDAKLVAEALRGLMTRADWQPDAETIRCSGLNRRGWLHRLRERSK
jgi:hypothetical protein